MKKEQSTSQEEPQPQEARSSQVLKSADSNLRNVRSLSPSTQDASIASPIRSPTRMTELRLKRKMVDYHTHVIKARLRTLSNSGEKLSKEKMEIQHKAKVTIEKRLDAERKRLVQDIEYKDYKEIKKKQLMERKETLKELNTKKKEDNEKLRHDILSKKRRDFQMIKDQQRENDARIQKAFWDMVDNHRMKSRRVRQYEEEVSKKLQDFHVSRIERLKEDREREIEEENKLLQSQELALNRLSKKELKVYSSVQKVKSDVNKAHTDLQDIVSSPLKQVEEKYSFYLPKKPKEKKRSPVGSPKRSFFLTSTEGAVSSKNLLKANLSAYYENPREK